MSVFQTHNLFILLILPVGVILQKEVMPAKIKIIALFLNNNVNNKKSK